MPAIPINEKPYYNTDEIANSIAADAMFNCHLEPVPEVGFVTRRRPGYTQFCDLGTGKPGDGLFYWDGAQRVVAVSNGQIFEVFEDGTTTDITTDTLNAGTPVVFADGQDTSGAPWLYMANGKMVYLKDTDKTTAPTDVNAPSASWVAFLKGRFLANRPGTNKFDVTDTNPDTGKKILCINVKPGLQPAITTTELRPVLAGFSWTISLYAEGGTGPFVWTAPTLPAGVSIAHTGGRSATLSSASLAKGAYAVSVKITDNLGKVATADLTLTSTDQPSPFGIDFPTDISATKSVRQTYQVAASGGTGDIAWSGSSLPTGVYIDAQGLLNVSVAAAGTYSFQVTASTTLNAAVTQTVTLTVADQVVAPGTTMTVTTASLPDATIGEAYTATLAATGAIGTLDWSATPLPPGLTISSAGVISGVPFGLSGGTFSGANGAVTTTISVTDSAVTGLLDNTYWSSTDNPLTCDAKGDPLNALFTAWQEIYAWGTQGLEIWQADIETPFAPIPGAFSEGGIEAPYSIAVADNTVFALCVIDKSRVVVKLQGRAPTVVSNPIARVLAEMETVSDAIFDIVNVGGLTKLLCNFPTAAQTWCYDYQNDVWERWSSYNTETGEHEQFIGVHSTFVKPWGKHLIMSRVDGKIYELSRNVYADDGSIMLSTRRTGWLNHGTYNRKRCDQFYLKVKCGDTDNATLLMRFRDDGQAEWSNYIEVPLKPLGNRDFMAKMNRFGIYRSRQYEFVLSDNTDMVLVGADTELTGLSS